MWSLTGTIPAFKKLLAGTIPAFKKLLAGTIPAFKKLLAGTVPAFKRLLAGTHKFYFFGLLTLFTKKNFTLKKMYGYLPLKGYWHVPINYFFKNTFYPKKSHLVTFLT